MAKLERTLSQDFDRLLHQIEQKLLQGSFTATLEDSSDFYGEGARCSVRVFERYSYFGGNRLSLNLTLFQAGNGPVQLSAITAGGSEAVFFKVNTIGEEAFLDKLEEILYNAQSKTGPLQKCKGPVVLILKEFSINKWILKRHFPA